MKTRLWLVLASLALSHVALAQDSFWTTWEKTASAIQAEQPHWATPLVTVTPRMEQEFRFDYVSRFTPAGLNTSIYDNGKGLELIPLLPIELLINLPPYTVHRNPKAPDGWGDWPLLLKVRLLSANEQKGNYLLTLFLGGTVPTGGHLNGNGFGLFSPSIAGGKGFGDFDVQTTAGFNIPVTSEPKFGHPFLYNVALQYHIPEAFLWPEVEMNGTAWRDGTNLGNNQIFITPGVVLGRFPLHALYNRLGLTFGAGIQIAATHFHQYDHAWTFTARMPF